MSDDESLVPGFILGPVIGKGGFASVYRAKQISLDREVAIKIDQRIVDDSRNARRFLREATASSLISSHPHVVSLIDAGTTRDKRPYLVMELCGGGSVAKLLKEHGPLRPADANELIIAVAGALAAAHENGILHRDIKPANILIDSYGTPRLGDFGLAAMPTEGEELSVTLEALTPAFASPQTFELARPTKAADVWSLGATLYTLITGHAPRRNPDGTAMNVAEIIQRLQDPLPAPTHIAYAEPLMRVVWQATSFRPEDRPSAAELRSQLVGLRGRLGPGRDVHLTTDLTRIVPEAMGGTLQSAMTPMSAVSAPSVMSPGTLGRMPAYAPAVTVPRKRRSPWLPVGIGLGVGLVGAVLVGGFLTNWFGLVPGGGEPTESTAPPVTTEWVAPAVGTCYTAMAEDGDGVSAGALGCEQAHVWETFATGTLADDVASPSVEDAKQDPAFEQACTEAALEEYTEVPLARLTIDVVPPSPEKFKDGERRFSCVATTGTRVGSLQK